jgi:aromatic-amino-acid transaminase
MFDSLTAQPQDSLLKLIRLYADDTRPDKIDVGVGVYRNEAGETPVLAAVKAAEARLLAEQDSKSYLGAEGDIRFIELLAPIIFGEAQAKSLPLIGLQTPGGTGALRLAVELVARGAPSATIWLWTPTWPNHQPIVEAPGLKVRSFSASRPGSARIDMAAVEANLQHAKAGDVLLVHAACHNPSGIDPSLEEWQQLAALCGRLGLVPLIDCAYQGLGNGLDPDVAGLRLLVDACDQALVAYSCDKNFGLYRDRVGALWVKVNPEQAASVRSNLFALARTLWSMPPDHGAAVVRIILDDPRLTSQWVTELDGMRGRINAVRAALAIADMRMGYIAQQRGLFAMLPLNPRQIERLRIDHSIYMAPSGRINVAGLAMADVPRFVAALRLCL